jgi:hypothetical protein
MFRLKSLIKIGVYEFNTVNSVTIDTSKDNFTDKAVIVIPSKLRFEGEPIFSETGGIFNIGDRVEIELSYDEFETQRFVGFISSIKVDKPITIECEDDSWLLKQFNLDNYFKNSTLEEVVKLVFDQGAKELEGYTYQIGGTRSLGDFTIKDRPTGIQAFDKLKSVYKILTYVRNKVFFIGFSYFEELSDPKVIDFERQVIPGSTDLVFKTIDTSKFGVKVKNINPRTNEKTEIFVGDEDGDIITVVDLSKLTGEDLKKQMKESGQAELDKHKYTGYSGSFTTLLHPKIEHSTIITIVSKHRPTGNYFVKAVTTSFSHSGGGRQKVTLDRISI